MRWASHRFPGCSEWLHLLLSHFLKTFFWGFRCRIISPIIMYMLIYFVPFNCQHEWLVSSLTSMYTLGNPFSPVARGNLIFKSIFYTMPQVPYCEERFTIISWNLRVCSGDWIFGEHKIQRMYSLICAQWLELCLETSAHLFKETVESTPTHPATI